VASPEHCVARILVIEDEPNLRYSIVRTLGGAGHSVDEAGELDQARIALAEVAYDLVLSDVNLGAHRALDLICELRSGGYDGALVLMTGYASIEDAVRAMREGADDYIQKPLNMDELVVQVERWLEQRRAAARLRLYERLDRQQAREQRPLGESAAWREAVALAERFASVPLPAAGSETQSLPTVLLLGETGTGKGVLARHYHECIAESSAQAPPFVHVNCSALPASLIESELFGHEKGAFTDAREARAGLFEMADGGTIFLDEIGEMPIELQSKLLVVVEQGTFRRVGDRRERRVRARIIAATNQDLASRVANRGFRPDLYYRLATLQIELPPLRDRGTDAVLIAKRTLEQLGARFGRTPPRLSDEALAAIAAHPWPGNVRELVNSVQRAVTLNDGELIRASDLGLGPGASAPGAISGHDERSTGLQFDFAQGVHTADEVEKTLMIQALEHTRGNVAKAARLVGMQRSSFRYRVERYGLEDVIREISQR